MTVEAKHVMSSLKTGSRVWLRERIWSKTLWLLDPLMGQKPERSQPLTGFYLLAPRRFFFKDWQVELEGCWG